MTTQNEHHHTLAREWTKHTALSLPTRFPHTGKENHQQWITHFTINREEQINTEKATHLMTNFSKEYSVSTTTTKWLYATENSTTESRKTRYTYANQTTETWSDKILLTFTRQKCLAKKFSIQTLLHIAENAFWMMKCLTWNTVEPVLSNHLFCKIKVVLQDKNYHSGGYSHLNDGH